MLFLPCLNSKNRNCHKTIFFIAVDLGLSIYMEIICKRRRYQQLTHIQNRNRIGKVRKGAKEMPFMCVVCVYYKWIERFYCNLVGMLFRFDWFLCDLNVLAKIEITKT